MQRYICYTDGSYQPSLGAGGWASIILDKNENLVARLYQGNTHTTNNRMELKAVIETLKYLKEPSEVLIVSDSQYVTHGIESGLPIQWVRLNDTTKSNLDLWFELVELLQKHNVSVQWIKGHDGNKWNEEADKWCVFAAQCYNIPRDIWTIDSTQKSLETTGT